jgi:hypothetical protein
MPPFEQRDQIIADLDMQSVMQSLQVQVLSDAGLRTEEQGAASVEKALSYLGQATDSAAAGLLLLEGQRLQLFLYRQRPVDDLFLAAMQQRMVSNYRIYAGSAVTYPEPDVTVYGQSVAGPYEPLRSLLVVPMLDHGHVKGMLSTASPFCEAFGSQDLCVLTAVAAQLPALLDAAVDGNVDASSPACIAEPESVTHQRELRSRVRNHVTSICGLARSWQMHDDSSLPEVLRRDLDAIAENALQIRDLMSREP